MKGLKLLIAIVLVMGAGCRLTDIQFPDLPELPEIPDDMEIPAPPPAPGDTEEPEPPATGGEPDPVGPHTSEHRAIFLRHGARIPSGRLMNILSYAISDDTADEYITWMAARGCTRAYVYMSNQGDGPPVSIYKGMFGGELSPGRVAMMRRRMVALRANGMEIIAWFFADDSPQISRAPMAVQKQFISDVVRLWNPLILEWVGGLEVDEDRKATFGSPEKMAELLEHLNRISDKPIGLHQTTGQYTWSRDIAVVDKIYYQYRLGLRADQIGKETESIILKVRKPVIAGEYDLDGTKGLGKHAINAGAVGFGNG